MKKESINSFANHAPKPNWVQEFFDLGNEYWEQDNNGLGKNQIPMFKRFLRECGVIDAKNPFKVVDDEKMQDLVESIRMNGVLSPVLLREAEHNGDRRKDQEEKKPSVMEKLQEKKKEAAEVEATKPKAPVKDKSQGHELN